MSDQQLEAATEAIRDAVRISIRPGGETMRLLDEGHTFHLTPDEANTAARAALTAAHPTITTVEGMHPSIVASFENGQPLVLLDRGCRAFIIWEDEGGDLNVTSWPQEGDPKRLTLLHISLPATVLYWGNK